MHPPLLSILAPVTDYKQLFIFKFRNTPKKANINASLNFTIYSSGIIIKQPETFSYITFYRKVLNAPPPVANILNFCYFILIYYYSSFIYYKMTLEI